LIASRSTETTDSTMHGSSCPLGNDVANHINQKAGLQFLITIVIGQEASSVAPPKPTIQLDLHSINYDEARPRSPSTLRVPHPHSNQFLPPIIPHDIAVRSGLFFCYGIQYY
jgi:hypothetical protein